MKPDEVAIIGAGDATFDYALHLAACNKVEMESLLADYVNFVIGCRPELSFVNPFIINHLDEFQQKKKQGITASPALMWPNRNPESLPA